MAIGSDFYPLYYHIGPKFVSSKEIALDLLKQVHKLLINLAARCDLTYPNLFLSVDSGFTDPNLMAYCEKNNIGFIGVPTKVNIIKIGQSRLNISKYIERIYLKKEKAYLEKCKKQGKKPAPFLMRKKAYVQALGKEVILVFLGSMGQRE